MKLFKIFPLLSLLAILGFSSFLAAAQTTSPTPPPAKEDEVIKVNSRLVVVPVSVTNANGEPVLGLKAENFRVREENKVQTIDSVGNAENVPFCSPPTATREEAIRVVVRYLDEHSELKMEEFGSVALEALEKAWPCK